MTGAMDKNRHIYMIGLDVEKQSAEGIVREAAQQIDSLFEQLIKEQKKERTSHESTGDT